MRDIIARAATPTDQEVAALALEAWSAKRLATFEDAERGLLFGRLDFEAVEQPLYVGRRWVHDGEGGQVVVNWQAPAARPFYTATPIDPQRVTLRRRFRAQGRRLLDIADESLDGTTLDGATVGDFLLEELERSRDTLHARHRRDDPGRPVPPDHPRARPAARDPGRARDGQDRGRAAPRLVAHLHRAGAERAQPRARRRPEPDLHGVRLARAAGARRGERRAARGLRARRRRDADAARRARRSRG